MGPICYKESETDHFQAQKRILAENAQMWNKNTQDSRGGLCN